ncbi:MAG: UvrD-helicase domain-containing protein [Magnetococcus sp. DMHC-6]
MHFAADLHIHSKYSRATSRDLSLENLSYWARRKGLAVLGTGDFTHPAWFAELQEKLVAAEPGLFRLRGDLEQRVAGLAGDCGGAFTRFQLTVEISTIYKKGTRTRKVHHLIAMPDLASAGRFRERLAKIGNIAADGRPILGLDSRNLLETVLESNSDGYLIPAHIWTPWFSLLGSQSGFDSVQECYGDLADHIFALETGLSSDPAMNWQLSGLDGYRLISCSDAHSADKLGREATLFEGEMDYFAIKQALKTGHGYEGTVEFFPQEGKYHLDGHRNCQTRFNPEQTRDHQGLCPVCGKPVTVGVLNRVAQLADRPPGFKPASGGRVVSLVPLAEIIAELEGVGPSSKRVRKTYDTLLARLGPELSILEQVPIERICRYGSPLLGEAMTRLRAGQVIRTSGYDGEYGVIRLFDPQEVALQTLVGGLFSGEELEGCAAAQPVVKEIIKKSHPLPEPPARETIHTTTTGSGLLAGLDERQRQAAQVTQGALLILAGPGTGKTRTVTHRIAFLVAEKGVAPERCLALTFTRKAAEEMSLRLLALLPGQGDRVVVRTFHALGWSIVLEHAAELGFSAAVAIATPLEQQAALEQALGEKKGKSHGGILKKLADISLAKRSGNGDLAIVKLYQQALTQRNLVDLDDLILLPVTLFNQNSQLAAAWQSRFSQVTVDEFQDLDAGQYALLRCLVPSDGNLVVIGDPDQSIYGFRGADIRFFVDFFKDYPQAQTVRLERAYRCGPAILAAALGVISASRPPRERQLQAVRSETVPVVWHEAASDRAEAEFIVASIEAMLGGHTFFSLDSGRSDGQARGGFSFADFALLYRTEAQSKVLCQALARSGMPFQKRSHARLTDIPEVNTVLARMALQLGSLVERLAAATPEEEMVQARLLLSPLAQAHGSDWSEFMAQVLMGVEVDLWDPRADRITLMTLHGSKGLEFPVVFLTGCEEGVLPLRFGEALTEAEEEEERRLFYVGMTRAKDFLWLTQARQRLWRGRVRTNAASPFLQGIQSQLEQRLAVVHPKKKVEQQLTLLF